MAQITRSPDHPIIRSHTKVVAYYKALVSRWGPQNWWPAQSRFEVVVGAYLTQNTNWRNVEKAMVNLRRERVLRVEDMRKLALSRLEELVRPSGYFRQKARKLKTFLAFLDEQYDGSLDRMFSRPTEELRAGLLALNGVGPETADSILLYAGNHPVFVVDAYTRRVLERHEIIGPKTGYEEIRLLVEQAIGEAELESLNALPPGVDPRHPASRMSRASRSQLVQHFNEFHALIVRVGSQYCSKTAKCEGCPLQRFLP
jgi:endonuclease-3 related protein